MTISPWQHVVSTEAWLDLIEMMLAVILLDARIPGNGQKSREAWQEIYRLCWEIGTSRGVCLLPPMEPQFELF